MGKERRPKIYVQLDNGYVRVNSIQDRYMYEVLHHNRTIFHKIAKYTLCKLFGHVLDDVTSIIVGFTNKTGEVQDGLCFRCLSKVTYIERLKELRKNDDR